MANRNVPSDADEPMMLSPTQTFQLKEVNSPKENKYADCLDRSSTMLILVTNTLLSVILGITYTTFGMFYIYFEEVFESGKGAIGIAGFMISGFLMVGPFISGPLIKAYGCQVAGITSIIVQC